MSEFYVDIAFSEADRAPEQRQQAPQRGCGALR